MKVIINQPRASYFIGGAEMISFEHAKQMALAGNSVFFFTISPKSIGQKYSEQYKVFNAEFLQMIVFIEIEQDQKIVDIYKIKPGENRMRWNIESIFYNQKVYDFLVKSDKSYDEILSYYILDATFIPRDMISRNCLYLCGNPKEEDAFQGSFLSVYDKVLAISNTTKRYWQKYYTKTIKVISTGVDSNRFKPKVFGGGNKNETRVLYIGRLIKRKNVDQIIFAIKDLRKRYNIKLTIVGDGPERKYLEKISQGEIIDFIGEVKDPENYFIRSDIFVSPSEFGEGLQGAVLEAMSCGLVVVASDTKVNRKLLENERGFLIGSGENDILQKIKLAMICDRRKIGRNARKYVVSNYNWMNKVDRIRREIEK